MINTPKIELVLLARARKSRNCILELWITVQSISGCIRIWYCRWESAGLAIPENIRTGPGVIFLDWKPKDWGKSLVHPQRLEYTAFQSLEMKMSTTFPYLSKYGNKSSAIVPPMALNHDSFVMDHIQRIDLVLKRFIMLLECKYF